MTVSWCNGSTTGFGPVSRGSNPFGTAIFYVFFSFTSYTYRKRSKVIAKIERDFENEDD